MWKIILLAGFVLILGVTFFWIKGSSLIKPEFNSQNQPPGKVLSDTASNIFNQTKETIEETSQNLTNSIKEQVYNQAQNTVNTVFDKPNPTTTPTALTVNILGVSTPPQGSFIIDFSKDSNLKFTLNKGTKYYLQFKNTPENYCLYIADNKYQIIDSKIVELQFNLGGTYPIRLNSCQINDKNLGELVVE